MSDEYAQFPFAAVIERWNRLPAAGRPFVHGYMARSIAELDRALSLAEQFTKKSDLPPRRRPELRLVVAP